MGQQKPVFSTETFTSGEVRKYWKNFFPESGYTAFLKYMVNPDGKSYISVGMHVPGDGADESLKSFKPDTNGSKSAVAYFQELTKQQEQKENPQDEDGQDDQGQQGAGGDGGKPKASVEDVLKELIKKMNEGGGDLPQNFDDMEKQVERPTQTKDGAEPEDPDMETPGGFTGGDFTGGDDEDGDTHGHTTGGGTGGPDDGENTGHGQPPEGGTTGGPVRTGQIDPATLTEAIEDYLNIRRGDLKEAVPSSDRLQKRLNLLGESEIQEIGRRVGVTGSKGEILSTIKQETDLIYQTP